MGGAKSLKKARVGGAGTSRTRPESGTEGGRGDTKVNEKPEDMANRPSGQSYSTEVWTTRPSQCRWPRIGGGGTTQPKTERLRTE